MMMEPLMKMVGNMKGMDRYEARKAIVKDLEEMGLFGKR